MTLPVGLVDCIGFIILLIALISLLLKKSALVFGKMKWILIILVVTLLFHSLSNTLEHMGSLNLDPFEDIIEILIPWLWGFWFYDFLQKLSRKELETSKRLLKEETELAELLIDVISHDLGNSQQVELFTLQLLERCIHSKEKSSEIITSLKHRVRNSKLLIENIKILMQLQKQKFTFQKLNLYSLIESAKERVHSIYYDIPINLKHENLDITLNSHPLLENVFINIFSNAIRYKKPYHDRASLAIRVSIDGDNLLLSFQDQGIGIADDLKEIIFDRFSPHNPERKGTGLGLSVSRLILQKMNGRIWAENLPHSPDDHSAGSSFYVLLNSCFSSV